ncbi:S8 family serine peptidase [uncultured Jatrophihabitans sp.]|uniref:S8 family peptidase n=1 Tax=uncultured Jatrophihabitans sp. TaxID=1610747 RepID=UPI0035CBDF26
MSHASRIVGALAGVLVSALPCSPAATSTARAQPHTQALRPAGQRAVPAVAPGAVPGPSSAPEYWFDAWDVPQLWAAGARGQGVTIAVIDTGVNAALPELRGRVLRGTDLGTGGDGRVDREVEAFGHGTAMASIMVGRPGVLGIRGLAPAAKVLPIAVPLAGTTDAERPDNLPRAVTYAADHGAKIISMSLGGTRTPDADSEACPADEQAAIFHALRKGAVVLAAVGNTGPTRNTVEEPGVCLGVVSVGAVDATGTVARFSGRQPYLTLVAPGVDVPSIGRIAGQAFSGSGTSQATALTAAAAALVWSKHPGLTNRQVVARLLATLDGRRTSPDPAYGYGELDAGSAVTAAVAADAPNPVFATAEPFLRRAEALAADANGAGRLGRAPPPATRRGQGASTGLAVDSASRLTDARVLLGGAIALVGLAVALLAIGALARRRRALEAPPTGNLPALGRLSGRRREDKLAS